MKPAAETVKGHGGARAGAGRKVSPTARREVVCIRLSDAEHAKWLAKGGLVWLRKLLK